MIKSKNDQVKAKVEFAKLFMIMGAVNESKSHIKEAEKMLKKFNGDLSEFKRAEKGESEVDYAEVDEFIKRGRAAMDINEFFQRK